MQGRYIILLGGQFNQSSALAPSPLDASLHAQGMICGLESASVRLFFSADTPLIVVPGRGVIVGRIFSRNGEEITGPLELDGAKSHLIHHLLREAWGEYLAILWDGTPEMGITLLRDPSGAVPCVYSLEEGRGFITSDIQLAVELDIYRREVDWDVLAHRLSFPYLRATRTALAHVRELLPGQALMCRGQSVSSASAWSPWRFVEEDMRHSDPRAAAEDVRSAVSAAVTALSASDDRLVAELSGGLDSSIVAACLRERSAPSVFCTLVMPVTGTDERPYAQLMASALGHDLFHLEVGFENIHFDFPTPPSGVAPAIGVLQQATNEVWEAAGNHHLAGSFFSGGGGDTVFCYLKTAAPAADAFRERGVRAGLSAIHDLSALHHCTLWKAGALTLKKLRPRAGAAWKSDDTLLNPARVALTPDHHPWMDAPSDALPGDTERIHDLMGTQMYRDASRRGEGRSTRFPLLSQPVMEACLRVPTWMWISGGRNRAIARDAFADILPRGILDRRSKGSYTGYMAAVYARNKHAMRQFLEEGLLYAHDLLDPAALSSFFSRELAPRDLSFLRIFELCTAENWARNQIQAPSWDTTPGSASAPPDLISRQMRYCSALSGSASS